MDELPFSVRKEIEGYPHADEATDNLINRYSEPPRESSAPKQSRARSSRRPGNPQNGFMQNLLMQMQQGMHSIKSDQDNLRKELSGTLMGLAAAQQNNTASDEGGFSISIGSDVVRWLLVLVAICVVIWFFTRTKGKRKNPLKKRLTKVEKEMRLMRRVRTRKVRRRSNPDFD